MPKSNIDIIASTIPRVTPQGSTINFLNSNDDGNQNIGSKFS